MGGHAGARVGGRRSPSASPRAVVIACGAQATAEEIALCSLQIRAIQADPSFRGGDYYDARARRGPVARAVARPRDRPDVATAPSSSSTERFGRGHQGDEQPLEGGRYAVESYLEYHGEKLAPRFDANTYIVLSQAMNHHDVGRGRGGIAAALARITGDGRRSPASPPTGSTRCGSSTSSPS